MKVIPLQDYPVLETLNLIWERRSIKDLRRSLPEHHPLFSEEDVYQDLLARAWIKIITKQRRVISLEKYLQRLVTNRIMDALRRMKRDSKYMKEKDLESDPDIPIFPPAAHRDVVDRITLRVERSVLGTAWRGIVFRDLLTASGAVGEPPVGSLADRAGHRSLFRAACAAHGISAKRQELFLRDLRELLLARPTLREPPI